MSWRSIRTVRKRPSHVFLGPHMATCVKSHSEIRHTIPKTHARIRSLWQPCSCAILCVAEGLTAPSIGPVKVSVRLLRKVRQISLPAIRSISPSSSLTALTRSLCLTPLRLPCFESMQANGPRESRSTRGVCLRGLSSMRCVPSAPKQA